MPPLFLYICTRKNPLSPHVVPQLFLPIQYSTPLASPHPTIDTSWLSQIFRLASAKMPPVQAQNLRVEYMAQVMGPLLQIQAFICQAPFTVPQAVMRHRGYFSVAKQPLVALQSLHTCSASHCYPSMSCPLQGWQVSSGAPLDPYTAQYTPRALPPSLQLPPCLQLIKACAESRVTGHVALRAMLMRSERALVAARAQQPWQNEGARQVSTGVKQLVLEMLRQSHWLGIWEVAGARVWCWVSCCRAGDLQQFTLFCYFRPITLFLSRPISRAGSVRFLSSLVHVSLGTPHEQLLSMPRLSTPRMSLTSPFSPQQVPQEFLTCQYLTPFSSPQPVTTISWSQPFLPVLSTKMPPVQLQNSGVSANSQEMGPRWQIQFIMATSPPSC